MSEDTEPIERETFDTKRLMDEYPPIWRHPNKTAVFEITCPAGTVHGGRLEYTRWASLPLPAEVGPTGKSLVVECREDVYDYVRVSDLPGSVEWHVNFADPELFVAYGSPLFAQDEIQVAEHPALGALREALPACGCLPVTVEGGAPTPVLIMGVERRCRVATDRDAAAGRPAGLYGNAFGHAAVEVVRRATEAIRPPTITNLIATAAPEGGFGAYTAEEIEVVLVTAYTGFRAAVLESARAAGAEAYTVVHTGFWGCGAFGGNRELMPALQIIAAAMAGIARLVFHTVDSAGSASLGSARDVYRRAVLDVGVADTGSLIEQLVAQGFEWGVSDGN